MRTHASAHNLCVHKKEERRRKPVYPNGICIVREGGLSLELHSLWPSLEAFDALHVISAYIRRLHRVNPKLQQCMDAYVSSTSH